jgi:hypothetical protein
MRSESLYIWALVEAQKLLFIPIQALNVNRTLLVIAEYSSGFRISSSAASRV